MKERTLQAQRLPWSAWIVLRERGVHFIPQAGTLGAPGTPEDLVLARHHALVFSSNHR